MPAPGVHFVKGHATENDFVVLPDAEARLNLSAAFVRAVCNRRAGVGGDGVLRVVRTADCPEVAHLAADAEWFMDYRNADGSLAEMCGNGVRVYARYLVTAGLASPGGLRLATRHGIRDVVVRADAIAVDMGSARIDRDACLVRYAGRDLPGHAVDLGNPHAVVLLDHPIRDLDLTTPPELDAERFPNGANVEFVNVHAPGRLAMRVFERGVGETRSCGTGACAAAAAAGAGRPWQVEVPGGILSVEWARDAVVLTGPAVLVAAGELTPEWLRRAGASVVQ